MNTQSDVTIKPNLHDINVHLYQLFPQAIAHRNPDAWIEISYARPDGKPDRAQNFSIFKLKEAAEFAVAKNAAGHNIYVGVAARQGKQPRSGRATKDNYLTSHFFWIDFDQPGDFERVADICRRKSLKPAMLVTTGTIPAKRMHLYFARGGDSDGAATEAANRALSELFGSDPVGDRTRILRLAGTVNLPSPDKTSRGYVPELSHA